MTERVCGICGKPATETWRRLAGRCARHALFMTSRAVCPAVIEMYPEWASTISVYEVHRV